MARRTRPRLSAAERGYGTDHRRKLAAAKTAWWPGQPCARCGWPILSLTMRDRRGRLVSAVDLGHADGSGKTRYAGLEHRRCNRSAGATLGNLMRGRVTSRRAAPAAASGCPYCGRPACAERICQLARVQAANLRVREGLTREQADEQMAARVRAALAKRTAS